MRAAGCSWRIWASPPADFGEAQVHESNVGLVGTVRLDGLLAVGGFGYDGHAFDGVEQRDEALADDGVIVDD